MSQQASIKRIDNLALIRAIAISSVVIYHTVLMVAGEMTGSETFFSMTKYTQQGQYGVDLFFVLSGFLIGRLYWEELKALGHVNIINFILRRILRTFPPYFIALFLAFVPVWMNRHQAFDWGYLFFIQNYYDRIPFFLVSWSLCVEEHFYIVLPILLTCIQGFKPRVVLLILLSLSFLPALLRMLLIDYQVHHDNGYYITATHFRFEGLILGVAASHIFTYFPNVSRQLGGRSFNILLVALSVLLVPILTMIPLSFTYYIGLSAIAFVFGLLVLSFSRSRPILLSKNPLVALLANSSYSIYLSHALVIHFVLLIAHKLHIPPFFTWLAMLGSIIAVGYLFYILIEKRSLALRDTLVPRFNHSKSESEVRSPKSEVQRLEQI